MIWLEWSDRDEIYLSPEITQQLDKVSETMALKIVDIRQEGRDKDQLELEANTTNQEGLREALGLMEVLTGSVVARTLQRGPCRRSSVYNQALWV